MEAKPLQCVPHSNSGKGAGKGESPSIKLGLGIGCSGGEAAAVTVVKNGRSVFTAAQLLELQQQAFIFKYIAAGLPVPLYLVLPIWKNLASSSASVNGDIYNQHLSLGFCPEDFDFRKNMMDPEPGRCRRTDGKKWRCSKEVVEGQKYCARHMHRGRQRSRKHVEASEIASSYTTPPKTLSSSSEKSNTRLSVSTSANLQLMTQSTSSNTSRIHIPTTACSKYEHNKSICHSKDTASTVTTTVNVVASPITNMNHGKSINSCNIDRKNDCINLVSNNNIASGGNNINIVSKISPRLGFSPNSVLQVLGGNASCNYISNPESEPRRCRRTDGKKWRCSWDVVPDQKYCGRHMHRGTKRHMEASEHDVVPTNSAAATSSAWLPPTINALSKAHLENPSTNLSISIPASSQLKTNDNKSPTTTSSDTTITDTIFSACETSNLSS